MDVNTWCVYKTLYHDGGGSVCTAHERTEFPLTVDYSGGIKNALSACGLSTTALSGAVVEHLSSTREGKTEVTFALFSFDDLRITSGDVKRSMRRLGYRPAEALELLVFRAANPTVQRTAPLVALGSCADTGCSEHVLVLSSSDEHLQTIELYPYEGGSRFSDPAAKNSNAWSPDFVFAAVLVDCDPDCACRLSSLIPCADTFSLDEGEEEAPIEDESIAI